MFILLKKITVHYLIFYYSSCWAFSAVSALEGAFFKKNGISIVLSEQNLVDCSGPYGNAGCNGGWPFRAFNYVIGNGGISTSASYPVSLSFSLG